MDTDLFLLPFKHVFIDIVGFTANNRPVDEQVAMVRSLNVIVRAVENDLLKGHEYLLLPTGDGMCISIVAKEKPKNPVPADLHLQVAMAIRSAVQQLGDDEVKFELRTGISEVSDDCMMTDVGGSMNVVGRGINLAQRIMSVADRGNILVSRSVHDTLVRDARYSGKFRQYWFGDKHHALHEVFLYVDGIWNDDRPSRLFDPPVPPVSNSEAKPDREPFELESSDLNDPFTIPIDVPVTDTTAIRFEQIPATPLKPYVFYFHVATDLDEKVWIGFYSGQTFGKVDYLPERTFEQEGAESPGHYINVRHIVAKRHVHQPSGEPVFRGQAIRINRIRLRGGPVGMEGSFVKMLVEIKD